MPELNVSEGEVVSRECPECEDETEQKVTNIKRDGSGFMRCQSCEKIIVCMAGTFPQS